MTRLTKRQARRLALDGQGLRTRTPFGTGKKAVERAVEQVGYIQLDTIAVVERAHHQALWARVPTYSKVHLDHLVVGGRLFEYWSHAAAILPMERYRFTLRRKHHFNEHGSQWFPRDAKMERLVLERVEKEGPLMARDFAAKQGSSGPWWGWKPAKVALENLYLAGVLMVARRRNFAKVYDLTERVLPPGVDTTTPSEEEQADHLVLTTLKAHGLATAAEIHYLRHGARKGVERALERLTDDGVAVGVTVEGVDDRYYCLPENLARAEGARFSSSSVRLLSPFDNTVIQRKRLATLFDYEYQIECYTPRAKRRWGYFCHSILCGDRFVGRFDAKAERKKGTLRVLRLYLEEYWRDDMMAALEAELRRFATFNGCDDVVVEKVDPRRRPFSLAT